MQTQTAETRQFGPRCARRALLALVIGLAITSFAWLAARAGGAGATHIRWDLISLQGNVLDAGGFDWAKAADGSQITLTGSGTWLSVPGRGAPQAVTGGGTWEALDKTGASIGSADYVFTGFVGFTEVPGRTPALGTDDKIGDPLDSRAGLLILQVLYSDGEEGVLTVSCSGGPPTPGTVFEGITTTKG